MSYLQNIDLQPAVNPSSGVRTISRLQKMRDDNQKIAVLTCYDASFATLMEACGVDVLLVGDSLGNVIQGHKTTLAVTLEAMLYHVACVARAAKQAYLIADMPFGSYPNCEQAYHHAVQLMRAGAHMVKLEGGVWLADTVRFLVERGIPVCGHVGLLPQSVHVLGGFKVQGKNQHGAISIKADALALQAAGAQMIVLEAVPATLASDVSAALCVPTIGIGAGLDCSGQVLVMHDLLGISAGSVPRFVKNFMTGQPSIAHAIQAYVKEVKQGLFPAPEHTFSVNQGSA